jgi:hypothetical protein
MKWIFQSFATMAVGLILVGAASAAGRGHVAVSGGRSWHGNGAWHRPGGAVRVGAGYRAGTHLRYYDHFSHRHWDGRYRRWLYFNPAYRHWYWWSPGATAWVPTDADDAVPAEPIDDDDPE